MIAGPKAENGRKGSKIEFSVSQNSKIDFNAIFSFWSSNHLVQHPRLTTVNYFQNCRTSRIDRDKVACREGGFYGQATP